MQRILTGRMLNPGMVTKLLKLLPVTLHQPLLLLNEHIEEPIWRGRILPPVRRRKKICPIGHAGSNSLLLVA
jgi:hypothetical protein